MITVTIKHTKIKNNAEYKYTITMGAMSWVAFNTDEGFNYFLNIIGGEFTIVETKLNKYGEGYTYGYIDRNVIDTGYWTKDIPNMAENKIACILLSNGSYQNGFAVKDDSINTTTIFRLNPNDENYVEYDFMDKLIKNKIYG